MCFKLQRTGDLLMCNKWHKLLLDIIAAMVSGKFNAIRMYVISNYTSSEAPIIIPGALH